MRTLTAIIHPGAPGEGGFWATCLEVPGANGQGATKQDCLANLGEAVETLLALNLEEARQGDPDAYVEPLFAC